MLLISQEKRVIKVWNIFYVALPVMVYNFPGAAAGIDLDSDLLIELSEHQNCFGVKVTYFFVSISAITERLFSLHVQTLARATDYPHIRYQTHIRNATHNHSSSFPDSPIFCCLLL